jgi:hypothetical protein
VKHVKSTVGLDWLIADNPWNVHAVDLAHQGSFLTSVRQAWSFRVACNPGGG